MEFPPKVKIVYISAVPLWGIISKGNYITISNIYIYLHPHVHCNILHNNQGIETVCPSTDEWIKKILLYVIHDEENIYIYIIIFVTNSWISFFLMVEKHSIGAIFCPFSLFFHCGPPPKGMNLPFSCLKIFTLIFCPQKCAKCTIPLFSF